MSQRHLYKYSVSYALLKSYVKVVHSLFYSEICIINPENVPAKGPVIFTPNHQNALMDALAILLLVDKQPVFMARADIFKKKTTSAILNFLKIIPVFRIRDGASNLSNNNQSFGIALRALGYGQAVGIMPEGNHGDQHVLRPLKKGISRFALTAQENFGNLPVKIIPVGLEYSHYTAFRSKLLVIFGTPVDVSEYASAYKQNPQAAFNALRERLASAMKKNMLNIDNPEYYSLIFNLKEIYAARLQQKQQLDDNYYFRFVAEKQVTERLLVAAKENPSLLDALKSEVTQYIEGLHKLGIDHEALDTEKPDNKTLAFEILRYLCYLPLFAISTAVNIIPYFICDYVSNGVKDTQFRSSFKFVLMAFLFPLWYLLFLLMPIPLITKVIILVPMPILGVLSYDYFQGLKAQWMKIRYFNLLGKKDQRLSQVIQIRSRIYGALDALF